MCGIVGYLGDKNAYPLLINGLRRLEYRGYDSAGVALLERGELSIHKCQGKVSDLEAHINGHIPQGGVGMGHTRWATHGAPNDCNAHPHLSTSGDIALIHNGIIENYAALKEELLSRGHRFNSDTDTEVLVNLIDDMQRTEGVDLPEAVRMALENVVGAYAIVVMDRKYPDLLVAARKSSPLVIGIGDGEHFIASDATPIVEHTKNVVYLGDGEVAIIERGSGLKIRNIQNQELTPKVQELKQQLEAIEKGGYDHFMLKEIHEQPKSIRDALRGRLNLAQGEIIMGGITDHAQRFVNAKRILIVGCGTSWHAGMVGEYLFEELARVPVEVEYASEFRYRNPIISEDDIVIAISQSGETADTLAAIELAKARGATIFGVCNVVGSSIARVSHAGAYTHAGPEIGVASTKAFSTQVAVLTMMALLIGKKKGTLSASRFNQLINELDAIPSKVEKVLRNDAQVAYIADIYKDSLNALYLGRGYTFPVALEGALKLKEISYIPTEAYPAGEMKHGPIALLAEGSPVVCVATDGHVFDKVVSNIQEVKARGAEVIAVATEGNSSIEQHVDDVLWVPRTPPLLSPITANLPLQLFAYGVARAKGLNVDQPRNLAKTVTVE